MLEDAHRINQILLNKLDEVCRKYHIIYFLDSGSLLGAVRHQSFIPWDDDVDVVFTREQYTKFLKIPKEVWGEDFAFVRCNEIADNAFFDFVPRIFYLKESLLLVSQGKVQNSVKEQYRNKLAIDLFILDDAYDSKIRQMFSLGHLFLLYGQAMGHRDFIVYSEYPVLSRVVIWVLSQIGKHRDLDRLVDSYDKVCKKHHNKGQSFFYGNYSPISYTRLIVKKEWYAEVKKMAINAIEYNVPIGYHEILSTVYGDYMRLPPEEERMPTHVKV